jgi:hypothetical protein
LAINRRASLKTLELLLAHFYRMAQRVNATERPAPVHAGCLSAPAVMHHPKSFAQTNRNLTERKAGKAIT